MPVPKSQKAMPNCDAVFIGSTRWCKWQAAQDEGLRPEEVPRTILATFHNLLDAFAQREVPYRPGINNHGLICIAVFEYHTARSAISVCCEGPQIISVYQRTRSSALLHR